MTTGDPQCAHCIHFRDDEAGLVCAAFPRGIPSEVVLNQVDHRKPVPGDHGIQFLAKIGEEHPLEGQ
jgi:hypothetical protein